MNITDLIAEFLQQGKSVTLPGICTLACEELKAHHDRSKGVFYANGHTVTCHEPQGSTDELLATIAERECVNADVAKQMFRNYLDALGDKLQRTGSHDIAGVGTLRSTAQGVTFDVADAFMSDGTENHAHPLEGVKQYTPAPNEVDPFAIFEQPSQPEPAPEPQPQQTPQTAETDVEPQAETITETVEDTLRQLENMPKSKAELKAEERAAKAQAKADKNAAKAAEKEAKANAKAAAKQAKADAKAASKQAKADAKAAKRESKQAAKAAVAAPAKQPKPKKERKEKKRRFPWLLLLLLLLLLCGAYFGYRYYSGTHTTTDKTGMQKHLDVPHTNDFTYNTDMIAYGPADVNANRDQVCRLLAPYINEYLASRRYSSARAAMMDRISRYAELRLGELLGDKMAVQRFLPYEDYIYNYNYDFLKMVRAARSRVTVQTELMNLAILDEILDQLVRELGLQPDEGGLNAKQVQEVKKAEQPKPVVTANFETASKLGFDIIAGFNVNRDRAAQLASRLKAQGCDAYIIDKNGLYYVSMGSAATQTAAEALYKHIKSWYDGDAAIKKW